MVFRFFKWIIPCLLLALLSCAKTERPPNVAFQKQRFRPIQESMRGYFNWPLQASISSPYGVRHGRFHDGIDLDGRTGDPIVAAAPGEVIYAGSYKSYGKMIIVKHLNGLWTTYAHNQKNKVKAGKKVKQGQEIALVGKTGNATGDHLHFEVRDEVGTYDPLALLTMPSYEPMAESSPQEFE